MSRRNPSRSTRASIAGPSSPHGMRISSALIGAPSSRTEASRVAPQLGTNERKTVLNCSLAALAHGTTVPIVRPRGHRLRHDDRRPRADRRAGARGTATASATSRRCTSPSRAPSPSASSRGRVRGRRADGALRRRASPAATSTPSTAWRDRRAVRRLVAAGVRGRRDGGGRSSSSTCCSGMNAHINLDLGVTAAEHRRRRRARRRARRLRRRQRRARRRSSTAARARSATVSPWLGLADRVGGGGDETLIRFSLVAARRQAWSVATRLAPLGPDERAAAVAAVDAGGRARRPRAWPTRACRRSAVLLLVRARERAAPGRRHARASPRCAPS